MSITNELITELFELRKENLKYVFLNTSIYISYALYKFI